VAAPKTKDSFKEINNKIYNSSSNTPLEKEKSNFANLINQFKSVAEKAKEVLKPKAIEEKEIVTTPTKSKEAIIKTIEQKQAELESMLYKISDDEYNNILSCGKDILNVINDGKKDQKELKKPSSQSIEH
jgi:hypothetical protein